MPLVRKKFVTAFEFDLHPFTANKYFVFPGGCVTYRYRFGPEAEATLALEADEAVYDAFLGSGTTLIAAEALSRRCLGMEIDPRYVQIAVERWQAFAGRKAERVDG